MRGREDPGRIDELRAEKSASARVLMTLAVALFGLLAAAAIAATTEGDPIYAPLIGAVAVAVWYGGAGPALLAVALCWIGALWLLPGDDGGFALGDSTELIRWAVSLGTVLAIVALSELLRLGQRRATTVAAIAEADIQRLEALNEVATALAASVSSSDVASALTTKGVGLVDADGAVVGLVEGDELVLLAPSGIAALLSPAERRLSVQGTTLLARAVAQGAPVRANDHEHLLREFPGSATLMPAARAAIAAPLRTKGETVGALGFVFAKDDALSDERVAFTVTMARLAEQALERARLYEREQETRRALDRILEVAPRFRVDDSEEATNAICREARSTFGADYGLLWRVTEDRLALIGIDPPHQAARQGEQWPLDDFPALQSAVHDLDVSFVPDVLEEAKGEGRALMLALGSRSSLRTPIVLARNPELVLSLSWKAVRSEPDRLTLAIVRRFADQAALALEELERRRAESVAVRRADDMRRLQSLTAELSNALTRQDVGEVAVEHVQSALDADAVLLALAADDRRLLRLVASRGLSEEEVAGWTEIQLDGQSAVASALERRQPHVYHSHEAVLGEFPGPSQPLVCAAHDYFVLAPLVAARKTVGVVVLSWKHPPALDATGLAYVESLASQVAQAIDRAAYFETEQTIAETLQRSVLPVSLPRLEGLQLAARYLPGSAEVDVGGDWFDAMNLPDGRVGLVVGDVVGKGIYAAASMGQLRNALRAFSVDRLKPSSVLARLSRLADEVLDTTFATVAYAVVDPVAGVCRIASAGHPPPLVSYPDGRVELVEGARGLPLGTGIESKYEQEVVRLPAGATLLLYSDGLVERRGRSIDDGFAELCAAVRSGPSAPDRMLEHVLERLVGDGERGDDIVVLAARLLPVAPRELDLTVSHDPSSLETVRDAMRVWLEGAPLDRADAENVVLATWEACANAAEHALDSSDGLVRVHAVLREDDVSIVVTDTGRWRPPTESLDRGLGLRLIKSVMSSVDIASGDDGTRVTIVKAIARDRDASPTEAR